MKQGNLFEINPRKEHGRSRRYVALFLTTALWIGLLSGCGAQTGEQAAPELLEPIEITLTGKKAVRGNIQDMEAYKGSVKSDSVSYAFSQGTHVEDLTVHVGQYIEKGDLIARVNTQSYEKELVDLKAEINYLLTINAIETQLADNQVKNRELELNQMHAGSTWYEEAKKQVDEQIRQKEFDTKEREFAIENKKAELTSLQQQNGSGNIYASESGYLTYVKDFSVDNPSGYVNAGEIIAVTAKEDAYYIGSTMPLVTAREASFVYAQIGDKQYELTYVPYDDSQLKRASNEGVTLESRFICEEDISGLVGTDVTVFAVSNYRENVLSISPDALFTENNTSFVYLLVDGEKVKQEVETGIHTKNAVEIISGIQEGDEVYSQSSDLPGSKYSLVTVEKSALDITKRYDTAKLVYPLVTQVVNDVDGARVKEIRVKNGQEVKAGDIIAVLEAGSGTSVVLDNSADIANLKRNYDYEMALYQTELEKLQKQENEMVEKKITHTASYKKLILEISTLQLNMQKETTVYEYETGRLQRDYAQNVKENGEIYITADRDGVIKELASLSEGYSLEKDTLICKIIDPDFTCVKLFADGVKMAVGSRVSIVRGIMDGELTGIVVSSIPEVQGGIYPNGMYISEKSSQSRDAVYIVLDKEDAYEKLGSFGVKVSVWNVENAIVVDCDCIYTQGDSKTGKRYVWVSEDGNLSKRYVTIGYLDGDVAWIVQGLSEGEQIVLEKGQEEAE